MSLQNDKKRKAKSCILSVISKVDELSNNNNKHSNIFPWHINYGIIIITF
jgi:hypothetical protein